MNGLLLTLNFRQ